MKKNDKLPTGYLMMESESDEYIDVIGSIVEFINTISKSRRRNDKVTINDNTLFIVTVIVGLITDPDHKLGKKLASRLYETYYKRKRVVKKDLFLAGDPFIKASKRYIHLIRFLYADGYDEKKIADALMCDPSVLRKHIKRYCDPLSIEK